MPPRPFGYPIWFYEYKAILLWEPSNLAVKGEGRGGFLLVDCGTGEKFYCEFGIPDPLEPGSMSDPPPPIVSEESKALDEFLLVL